MPTRKSSSNSAAAARKTSRSGQTLVEFIFVSILFVFMVAISFNAVLAMSLHQYMSFAAFMSARAYQASASDKAVQVASARGTLSLYLPGRTPQNVTDVPYEITFPVFSKPGTILVTNVVLPPGDASLDYGPGATLETQAGSAPAIVIEYVVPIANLPLGDELAQISQIKLRSRAYLGREVSQSECRRFFTSFFNYYTFENSGLGGSPMRANESYVRSLAPNMEDNGC